MTDTVPPSSPAPSRKKLLVGSAAALAVAAVALVVFVLPAEYGIDPTGAGAALGLNKLSGEEENIYLERGRARTDVLFPVEAGPELSPAGVRDLFAKKGVAFPAGAQLNSDRFTFELLPYEGIELKYVLDKRAPRFFSWHATAPVNFDMHAHPFEGGVDLTESYAITDASTQAAVYVAPFTGIHGWYWQNRTLGNVTLTLDATGAFTASKIFDQAGEHDRPLAPPSASAAPAATAPDD
jgi:hypothetical protein